MGIQIKEEFPNLHIILTSAFKEYLEDGYKTKADRFFIKPIQESLFKTEMKQLLLSYKKNLYFTIQMYQISVFLIRQLFILNI